MRIFLGIKIPPETKKVIEDAMQPIFDAYPNFKWVPPDNYHITVHFFGTVTDVKPVISRIDELLFAHNSFELKLYSGGIFIGDDITLYVDFYRSRGMEQIARTIDEDTNRGKIFRFIPHVTVGKYKIPSKQQYLLAKKKMESLEFEHEFKVDKITLFESVLSNKTPIYTPLHEFVLNSE